MTLLDFYKLFGSILWILEAAGGRNAIIWAADLFDYILWVFYFSGNDFSIPEIITTSSRKKLFG